MYFTTILDTPWSFTEAAINAGIRIAVLAFFAFLVDRVSVQSAALRQRVAVLEGILPVCLVCKRIRDERARWLPLEEYTRSPTAKEGTNEVCPDCRSKLTETYDRR